MTIPIFIPHLGCPHSCVFCDQRSISGCPRAPGIHDAREIIEKHLTTAQKPCAIAFFGGSFTALDLKDQSAFLTLAKDYADRGLVSGIRLSTRPDCIDEQIIENLLRHGVTNVELGAQSMDDGVLAAAQRGHTAADTRRAAALLRKADVPFGLQMMTGLKGDDPQKALATAREIVALGAAETRIYPVLTLKNTGLEAQYRAGDYVPQSLDEAVDLAARLYEIFSRGGVKTLRIGLMNSESLEKNLVAGPYSPRFGEMVFSRVARNFLESLVCGGETRLFIEADPRVLSKLLGQGRENINYLGALGARICVKRAEGISGLLVNKRFALTI